MLVSKLVLIVQATKASLLVIDIHRTNPPGRDIWAKLIGILLNKATLLGIITFLIEES